MVLGLFIITAIPTVTGICQAYSAQKNQEQRLKDEQRMRKFHIDVQYEGDHVRGKEVDSGRMVLKEDRLWVGPPQVVAEAQYGYVAAGFYIEYPDKERDPVQMGLASQVRDDPPLLNWLYVDADTMEVKYGNKTTSIDHHVGSWDWTKDEEHVTFEDVDVGQTEEFYVAYNPKVRRWQLYYDMDQDGLDDYVPKTWIRLPVRLRRVLVPGQ